MAVTEHYTSREMHITKDGTTLTRIYTCTATDWNAQIDIPQVGDYWSEDIDRLDLRVTDVTCYWLSNTNCRVEVLYSSKGVSHRTNIPDKFSSYEHSFDLTTSPRVVAKYWDATTSSVKVWAEEWTGDDDALPELEKYFPHMTFSYKCNVSSWDYTTIMNSIGKVNDADMIVQWKARVPTKYNRDTHYDATGDDTGKWLFSGFTANTVGDANSELTFTFLYDPIGWNTPYGVSVNLYGTFSPFDLPFPDDVSTDVDDGIR